MIGRLGLAFALVVMMFMQWVHWEGSKARHSTEMAAINGVGKYIEKVCR